MALESMDSASGARPACGARCSEVRDEHPPLAAIDLDALMARAEEQIATLERERLAAGRRALGAEADARRSSGAPAG